MKPSLAIKLLPNGEALTLNGRNAWTLARLIEAGARGVSPLEKPAPRWSAYIFNLRSLGLHVETVDEPHGGDFAGMHARYVLRTSVRVLGGAA